MILEDEFPSDASFWKVMCTDQTTAEVRILDMCIHSTMRTQWCGWNVPLRHWSISNPWSIFPYVLGVGSEYIFINISPGVLLYLYCIAITRLVVWIQSHNVPYNSHCARPRWPRWPRWPRIDRTHRTDVACLAVDSFAPTYVRTKCLGISLMAHQEDAKQRAFCLRLAKLRTVLGVLSFFDQESNEISEASTSTNCWQTYAFTCLQAHESKKQKWASLYPSSKVTYFGRNIYRKRRY